MTESPARRAVVIGSSAGIGAAIARKLLEDGWSVVGVDRVSAIIDHPSFASRQVDLTDSLATVNFTRDLPDVQALVHAAGFIQTAPLGALDNAAGRAMWQINAGAATLLANHVVPNMIRQRNGRIILISSRAALGIAGRGQYAAAKAALVGLARSWAAEVVASGITVNVISPAATRTAMLDDPTRVTSTPQLPPMGRYIEPSEIAALASFLLSPQAAAITGQEILICGGASL